MFLQHSQNVFLPSLLIGEKLLHTIHELHFQTLYRLSTLAAENLINKKKKKQTLSVTRYSYLTLQSYLLTDRWRWRPEKLKAFLRTWICL